MADPTDRQRAEAKAREIGAMLGDGYDSLPLIADVLLEAEQRARGEGWEAGREEAAKWHEAQALATDSRITDLRHQDYAKAIRSLKPKE